MKGKGEFGGFKDNCAAFETIKYNLEQAQQTHDGESFEEALRDLGRLRQHVESISDPKSIFNLLPEIQALLKKSAEDTGRLMCLSQAPEPGHAPTISGKRETGWIQWISGALRDLHPLRRLVLYLERLLDSFLLQGGVVLCNHFLLVLSVLLFGVIINEFLSRFHVEIKDVVGPIVRTTDILLVAVFCAESLILLVITATREIMRKYQSFWQEIGSQRHPEKRDLSPVDDAALKSFQQVSQQRISSLEKEMACGRFTKDAIEMPDAFAMLGCTYTHFDAVSRDELPFWLMDPTDPFAEEYFLAGADLVRNGKKVTRIFLLSSDQLQQAEILKQVLMKHLRAGIGFAVVPFETLPAALRKRARELDFGLWDRGSAYSLFRQREGGYARKMEIVFSSAGANFDVATKVDLYRELLIHAWLADEVYCDCHMDIIPEHSLQLTENNKHLQRRISDTIKPEGTFYIVIKNEMELSNKVDRLLRLLVLTRTMEETPIMQKSE